MSKSKDSASAEALMQTLKAYTDGLRCGLCGQRLGISALALPIYGTWRVCHKECIERCGAETR